MTACMPNVTDKPQNGNIDPNRRNRLSAISPNNILFLH